MKLKKFLLRYYPPGIILDFEKGRDVINLEGLGLTPWDLTPSIQGRDLALAFEAAGRPAPWQDCSQDPCHGVRCAELFDALLACRWPGNIRELVNLCRELAVACPDDLSLPPALARRLAALPSSSCASLLRVLPR